MEYESHLLVESKTWGGCDVKQPQNTVHVCCIKTSNLKGVSIADHEFIISQLAHDTTLYDLSEEYSKRLTVKRCFITDVAVSS